MTFDPIGQASIVLDPCGRPAAPAGSRFVDLPYMIPFLADFSAAAPTTPQQQRVKNSSRSAFLVKGIAFGDNIPAMAVRVKWPSGRYLSQNPSPAVPSAASSPPGVTLGVGGNMLALDSPERIEPGASITVEVSSTQTGVVNMQFWGALRTVMPNDSSGGDLQLMTDPIAALGSRRRYRCGPPQNIMAPEFRLGNQCTPETPAGFVDEPFTFFSPSIAVTIGSQVYNTAVVVPGSDDVVIKRVRALSTYSNEDVQFGGAWPVFAMRLPSGYSLTGGDMVPAPLIYWWPWLPSVRVPFGQRIIIDMGTDLSIGSGTITTVFEFDAVKRRKVA